MELATVQKADRQTVRMGGETAFDRTEPGQQIVEAAAVAAAQDVGAVAAGDVAVVASGAADKPANPE